MERLLQVLLMVNCIYEGEMYVKGYIELQGISYSRFNSQAILAKLDDIIHINNHFIRIDKTQYFLDRIEYTINDIKENG